MQIHLLYSLGCPKWGEALERLKEILVENGITRTIIITRIQNSEDAKKFNAHGTPSILINGKDIDKSVRGKPCTYSCRFYIDDGKLSRIPPEKLIREAVDEALKNEGRTAARRLFALTGGIATGKSTVLTMFKDLGAYIIDADKLSHEALYKSAVVHKKIVDSFGKEVLDKNGIIDRKKLGEIVWKDDDKRQLLEYILHPIIISFGEKIISDILKQNPDATIIYDIPVLYEGNYQNRFKKTILVYADYEIQKKRLMRRSKISEEMAQLLISKQIRIEKKLELADYIIDNSGTIAQTKKQVEQVWEEISNI